MKRLIPLLVLLAAGCVPVGGYMSAEVVYAEPPVAVYEVPVDRVIVVSRDVLVSRGYVVYRVETRGPNRVIWARRGNDEVVRLFVTPQGRQVAVRSVAEVRDRGRHRGWQRHEAPREIVTDIDVRLHAR